MNFAVEILHASPFEPRAQLLIEGLRNYHAELYAYFIYSDSPEELAKPHCQFFLAYRNGEPVGMGAAKKFEGYGEIKSVFVNENFRGMGIAQNIVGALEKYLLDSGRDICRLETGKYHTAALRFYARLGYETCERFGDYPPNPLSVFMEKKLRLC